MVAAGIGIFLHAKKTAFSDAFTSLVLWIAFIVIIVWYENKMESKRIRFVSKRPKDLSIILQELSAYLAIDYSDVVAFKKSLRGIRRAKSFEQKFKLKQEGNYLVLTQTGDLPFPVSILVRNQINKKISHELARYSYFDTQSKV